MILDLDSSIDVGAVRADTPSCIATVHLNNAGASPTPEPVHRAMIAHLELERRIGGYAAAERAAEEVAAFSTELAALFGAAPEEIAFAESATRAWHLALHALPLEPGDRILTHDSEYASNWLELLHQARRRGTAIDLVPSDAYGQIDTDALGAMIGPRTRVVALTHAPTGDGLLNPAEEVGRIARDHGLFYLLDACQSAGQVALDVHRLGCDLMTGTGRKFLRGPRGTGFLYVRAGILERLEPPVIDLNSADWTGPWDFTFAPGAARFECFEQPIAARIGLARAARYARAIGMARIEARVGTLSALLRTALAEVPGVTVHDRGRRRTGIVTFTKAGENPAATRDRLRRRGIEVSITPPGHGLLDLPSRAAHGLVRASVHYFNTEAELMRLVDAVKRDA